MHPKTNPNTRKLPLIIIAILVFIPLLLAPASGLQLTGTQEYINYVHTNISINRGNFTYIEKPVFPVMINDSQIQIGNNWTIIVPLKSFHNYHVYYYGTWINRSVQAKTDYDILVYDPKGALESSHTESAGLPPHLGTTTDDAFFTPTQTGNYSFVIVNSPFGSQGAQQGTFMLIENLQTDTWQTSYLEGATNNNTSAINTARAYEFVTNSSTVAFYANVPKTLCIYEARLYLMNTATSQSLNSYPLAWEPGLYGNITGGVGGYNFDPNGYRGIAYASDEYMGQPIFFNYTASSSETHLYHLVLIAKSGSGNVDFMLKTKFGNSTLTPIATPTKVYPDISAQIAYQSNNASLSNAELEYTTDNWNSTTTLNMAISNQTCNATIPALDAGKDVAYLVNAKDILENVMIANGSYSVKQQLTLNLHSDKSNVTFGQNITISGALTPAESNSTVTVQFFSANSTDTIETQTDSDGHFTVDFKPKALGSWGIIASTPETKTTWQSDSDQLMVKVVEPPFYVKYSLYIIIGLVVASAVGGIVWFLKFRNK
jgi:hypothetical protein